MSRMITSCKRLATSLKPSERVMNLFLSPATATSKNCMLYKIMQTCLHCKTMTCRRSLTNSSWPMISSETDSIARHALIKWKTEMWYKKDSLWCKWTNLAHRAETRQAALLYAKPSPTTMAAVWLRTTWTTISRVSSLVRLKVLPCKRCADNSCRRICFARPVAMRAKEVTIWVVSMCATKTTKVSPPHRLGNSTEQVTLRPWDLPAGSEWFFCVCQKS